MGAFERAGRALSFRGSRRQYAQRVYSRAATAYRPFATGRQDVKANQRIVMNFYTAKRLLTALSMTIQRHEGTFGSIELDVRRRAGGQPGRPTGPQGVVE